MADTAVFNIEVISNILKICQTETEADMELNNGERIIGKISQFDGSSFLIDNSDRRIMVSDVKHVCEKKHNDYSVYVGKRVYITYKSDEQVQSLDGVCCAFNDNDLSIITISGLTQISIDNIVKIDDFLSGNNDAQKNVSSNEKKQSENDERMTILSDEDAPNDFETALLSADKDAVEGYVCDTQKLIEMGYSEEEIEKITKSINKVSWDNDKYKTASRIFRLQLNKHRLAECMFEQVLKECKPTSATYSKILNCLANIKSSGTDEDYIIFFKKYYAKTKRNTAFVKRFSSGLTNIMDWKQFEEYMPLFEEVLVDDKTFLEELKAKRDFYKHLTDFDIKNCQYLSQRYDLSLSRGESDDERKLLERLPGKSAMEQLLERYDEEQLYEPFFELVDLYMFDIKKKSSEVERIKAILVGEGNGKYLMKYLPMLPILWCEAELIKKYKNLLTEDNETAHPDILEQMITVENYSPLNEFEEAIISGNVEIVLDYIQNTDKLERLGYDDAEINEISAIKSEDVESILESDYLMRRILAFQGNKNHIAERFLLEAYYSNKIDMCNRLFPLLLDEGRGALVLSIFNFDEELSLKLPSYNKFYLKALYQTQEDDEVFWNEALPLWADNADNAVIDRLKIIAEKKGEVLLQKQLELRAGSTQGNEFELAVMKEDNEQIRKFVKNANLLVELGYTPEEIQKISKTFMLKSIPLGSQKVQIARRVFLYQKNKNNLAERLFIEALNEEDMDEAVSVSKELYPICVAQKNYDLICELYEGYIFRDMEKKFNREYAKTYCIALHAVGRYEDLYKYWEDNKDRWDEISLNIYMLYAAEALDRYEYEEEFFNNVVFSNSLGTIVSKYIELVLLKKDEARYNSRIVPLFNTFYWVFTNTDILRIKNALTEIDLSVFEGPDASGILAYAYPDNCKKYIIEWIDYIKEHNNPVTCGEIIIKIKDLYSEPMDELVNRAVEVYEEILNNDNTPALNLRTFLMDLSEDESWKARFIDLEKKTIMKGKGTIDIYGSIIEKSQDIVPLETKFELLLGIPTMAIDLSNKTDEYLHLLMEYYFERKQYDSCDWNQYVDNMVEISSSVLLSSDICCNLARICYDNERSQEAKVYLLLLAERGEINECASYFSDEYISSISYLDFAVSLIKKSEGKTFEETALHWSYYFELKDDDRFVVDRLNNNINTPELWLAEEVEILCKAMISEPGNIAYLKTFAVWAEKNKADDFELQIALMMVDGDSSSEKIMKLAIKCDRRKIAIDYALQLLNSKLLSEVIGAQKALREMISNGWGDDELLIEKAPEILQLIFDKKVILNTSDFEWNSACVALDFAIATQKYTEYLDIFEGMFDSEYAKHLCVFIPKMIMRDEKELVLRAKQLLENCFFELPYKKLVLDFIDIYLSRSLNEVELGTLDFICSDYGNLLGIVDSFKYYNKLCIERKHVLGVDIMHLLRTYIPEDPLIYEIESSFIKGLGDDMDCKAYYDTMFSFVKGIQNKEPVEYYLCNMVCGENYLRLIGESCDSFTKWIAEYYPEYETNCGYFQEFCDHIHVQLRNTKYEEYEKILLKAVFTTDWVPVFEYYPEADALNEIVNNLKTTRYNIPNKYYRSVVASVARYCLKHTKEEYDGASSRFAIIWEMFANIVGCSLERFVDIVMSVEEPYKAELNNIWLYDIENISAFKKFFGSYILMNDNCERYAKVFLVFVNGKNMDIFNNVEVRELLDSMSYEDSIRVCEEYEGLYLKADGLYEMHSSKKKEFLKADYCLNMFYKRIKYISNGIDQTELFRARFAKKYETLKVLFGFNDMAEVNTYEYPIEVKRQIFSVNGLMLFFSAICSDETGRQTVSDSSIVEFINVTTAALSSSWYIQYIDDYISKFGEFERKVLGIQILIEKYKLEQALNYVEMFEDDNWRQYLAIRIRSVTNKGDALRQRCAEVAGGFRNQYFIRNYVPCKQLLELNEGQYLENIEFDEPEENKAEDEANVTVSRNTKDVVIKKEHNTAREETDEDDGDGVIIGYVENILIMDDGDPFVAKCKQELENIKKDMASGKDVSSKLRGLSIEAGIFTIRKSGRKIDSQLFGDVLKNVKPYCIKNSSTIAALHDLFQRYILGFDSLNELCSEFNKVRKELMHLSYEQNMDSNSRMSQDIAAISVILNVLNDICDDISSAMGEESLKDCLVENQKLLLSKTNSYTKFRRVVAHIVKLIQGKNNSLGKRPVLVISHTGKHIDAAQNKNDWKEVWYNDTEQGILKGVIQNVGGAPACDVSVEVSVNGIQKGVYEIKRIYENEKVTFQVSYSKEEVANGAVHWNVFATFTDIDGTDRRSTNVFGYVTIEYSEEEWDTRAVGREAFNTQTPADEQEFCGRQNELMILNSMYNPALPVSTYPSMLVTGLRRAGKSSVIKFFCRELEKRDNLIPIYVDAQGSGGNTAKAFITLVNFYLFTHYRKVIQGDLKAFKDKWDAIALQDDWMEQLPFFYFELSELFEGKKIIFILDEMEQVFYGGYLANAQAEERFFGIIRSLIQNSKEYVSFIFCGSDKLLTSCLEQKRESQLFQALQRIYVGRMSINDIHAIFDRYNDNYSIKFSDEAQNYIMKYTNGLVWYTKVIAYHILDKVIDKQHIMVKEISLADVDTVVEMLISGDLGSELIDLLDNNFGAKRKAIIRAMAGAAGEQNKSVSVAEISSELSRINYIDNDTGEALGYLSENDILENLNILEKMDFVAKDTQREKSYIFTTELYRMLMLSERKIHKLLLKK